MAFNDGITDTDKSSIEFRIADSLTRELGTMSVGDLERITSKIAFVIRFKLGAQITAPYITTLVKTMDTGGRRITIWAHLSAMCLQELFSAEGGSGEEAIMYLGYAADWAVEQVMKLKDAPSLRKKPLLQELGEDVELLTAANGRD
ncbi:hypothetical protein HBH70_208610 [Parastagonospora nodorum]|nr:hypothetical protein HBH70_208610 [Parastagonospora nodorum]KAH5307778.1 hypothetical protein HBI11_111850 [Parastagonospora nodorum]KAH5558278.1 hypothetical protein HBI26_209720 [Parastagonospora nodorum]